MSLRFFHSLHHQVATRALSAAFESMLAMLRVVEMKQIDVK
jgi:hypothetical protein